MWSKLGNVLKRPTTPGLGHETDADRPPHQHQPGVMSSIFEQHPNMSVFHHPPQDKENRDVPFPSPSPPTSPTRRKVKLLKRLSKNPLNLNEANDGPSAPSHKIHMSFPKRVKSSLHSISTSSEMSLNRPSLESTRSPDDVAQPSLEAAKPSPSPATPHDPRFSSLRSILKPNNTPGTGASVRFFSRDAHKVISPDPTNSSSERDDSSRMMGRIQRSHSARPSALEVFSPPPPPSQELLTTPASPTGLASLMMPVPPPSMSNIFDLSAERDLSTIPAGSQVSLLDSAIEISQDMDDHQSISEDHSTALEPPSRTVTPFRDLSRAKSSPAMHDRSQSFSFGQTVFHSMAAQSTPSASEILSKASAAKNRSRAVSDTVFRAMGQSIQLPVDNAKLPEADINDTSLVAVGSPERERDPFGAHSMTYYVPGTSLPPSPPQGRHVRKASREEDLIWSLRTQLALKDEMCSQFQIELNAKDDLLMEWQSRTLAVEKENESRKMTARAYRKKIAELTKLALSLEEEVERSRESSLERSIMDEASGQALQQLHGRINELEYEVRGSNKKEQQARRELDAMTEELQKVKEALSKKQEREDVLKEDIKAAREEMEEMGAQRQSMFRIEEQLRATAAASTWELEKVKLTSDNDSLRDEQIALRAQLTDAREDIVKKEEGMGVLRAELEAQWKHTEKAGEDIEKLTQERNALKAEVDMLNSRISDMEMEWTANENKKATLDAEIQELWTTKEEVEGERDELGRQLRQEADRATKLTQSLQQHEDRISMLMQERQYAQDTASRLQENIKQRDNEMADYSKRFRERDDEVENIREEMVKAKREHSRIVDEQSRKLSEVVAREVQSRAHMESVVREKAETDVLINTLTERVEVLKTEVERLRRQVHELQQESADKEVKLAQVAKQRAQDKEDLQGLNIALDSKQQELELLKRRVSLTTRGSATAGTTPPNASKPTATMTHRRESSIFTPSVSRPPSVISDAGSVAKEPRKLSDPLQPVAKAALGRSVRVNAAATSATSLASKRAEGPTATPLARRSSYLASSTASATPPARVPSLGRPPSVTPTATGHRASSSADLGRSRLSITGRSSLGKENIKSPGSTASATPSPPTSKPARRMSTLMG